MRISVLALGRGLVRLKVHPVNLIFSIWTQDVAAELSAAGNTSVETVGFDISAAQFPKNPAPGSKFVTADITKGFPEEYHNTFDVVHVRYIVLALSVPQIKIAVENALTLLSKAFIITP